MSVGEYSEEGGSSSECVLCNVLGVVLRRRASSSCCHRGRSEGGAPCCGVDIAGVWIANPVNFFLFNEVGTKKMRIAKKQ